MISNWTLTDPSCNQYGRKISDRVYEFKQDVNYPDGTVEHIKFEIDLNEYTNEEVSSTLLSYGYDEPQSDWITAECLFEMNIF